MILEIGFWTLFNPLFNHLNNLPCLCISTCAYEARFLPPTKLQDKRLICHHFHFLPFNGKNDGLIVMHFLRMKMHWFPQFACEYSFCTEVIRYNYHTSRLSFYIQPINKILIVQDISHTQLGWPRMSVEICPKFWISVSGCKMSRGRNGPIAPLGSGWFGARSPIWSPFQYQWKMLEKWLNQQSILKTESNVRY